MKDVSDIIFTKEECDKIISYSNFNDFSNRHKIYYGTTSTYKSCKLLSSEKTYWVFDRLYSFLEDSLNLKVIKPLEDLMINKYNTNDSFLKHRDLYFKNQIYNIVVNLNDAYLGDGFVLYEPDYTLERITGNACIFENTRWHEVKKIESGERLSMIAFFFKENIKHNSTLI